MDIIEIPAPGFSFSATAINVNEGDGTADFSVELASAFPDTTTVVVSLSTAGTATDGADFSGWMDTTLTFPSGSVGPVSLSIAITDDGDVEADETIVLELSNPTSGPILGDSVLTITIEDNDYVVYPIDLVTADNDMNGVGDSLGVVCEVRGVVHGVDLQGSANNLVFTIIDGTGGIGVASFGNNFGYTVTEGDSVHIPGTVDVFNGLTQMAPDDIILISSGNPIQTPTVVTTLDETTESELITIECLALLDTAQWPTTGGSVNLQATNGVDTFAVRIDSDVDINGTLPPTKKWLNITGIGGQFDSGDPALGGYQLLPRYVADVVERPDPTISFEVAVDTVDESAGTVTITITQTDGNPDSTTVVVSLDDATSTATNGDDFTFVTSSVRLAGCGESSTTITLDIIDDSDFEGDETVVLNIGEVSNNAMTSIGTLTVTITDNDAGAISDLLPQGAINMFPNPATEQVMFRSDYRMEQISLRNLLGQEVMTRANAGLDTQLNVSTLPQGVYLIVVETEEGVWRQKLVIE